MLLKLANVEKHYGAQPVLRGVSLEVQAGESVALVGRSGSGKSTLLNVVGALDRHFAGTAEVIGHDVARASDAELARLRNRELGFVFQAFLLLDHLTVRQNVALPAFFAGGLDEREMARRADEVLERVGLGDRAGERPTELSGGQKQRVAIARALFHKPRLLLADEPTGNLDVDTGEEVLALFRELNAAGLTLFIVTHEERVSKSAGRVLRISDGKLEAAQG